MTESNDKLPDHENPISGYQTVEEFVERCRNNPEGLTLFVGESTKGYSVDREAVEAAEARGILVTHEWPLPKDENAKPSKSFGESLREELNRKPDITL